VRPAVAGYLLMCAVLGYAFGFFARVGVPRDVDRGTRSPWPGSGDRRRRAAGSRQAAARLAAIAAGMIRQAPR
jgi:hypothetical protein